jgi:hypothetical protein
VSKIERRPLAVSAKHQLDFIKVTLGSLSTRRCLTGRGTSPPTLTQLHWHTDVVLLGKHVVGLL